MRPRFYAIFFAFVVGVAFIFFAQKTQRVDVSQASLKFAVLDDGDDALDYGDLELNPDLNPDLKPNFNQTPYPIHNNILNAKRAPDQYSKLSQSNFHKQSQEQSAAKFAKQPIPFGKKSVIKSLSPSARGGGGGGGGGDGDGGGRGGEIEGKRGTRSNDGDDFNDDDESEEGAAATAKVVEKKSYFHYLKGEKPRQKEFSVLRGIEGYYNLKDGKLYTQPNCGSCALVSSSGQLIASDAGAAIDAHECVFRMNVAPVKGFEKDVGNKTTIRFLSHTSVPLLLRDKNNMIGRDKGIRAVIQWGPNDDKRRKNVAQTLRDNFLDQIKFRHTEFYSLTEQKLVEEDESFEKETGMNRDASGSFLSTGWFTISFMRKLCKEINIYGMVNDDYCRSKPHASSSVPYHYWEQKEVKECATYIGHEKGKANVHRFITEKKVFKRWAKTGKPPIRFFHPEWS